MGLPKPQPKAEAATTSCENRKSRWNLSTYHIRLSCFECRFQTGIRSLRNCAWFILRARICLCHSRAILSSELQLLDLSRENGCVSIWRRSDENSILDGGTSIAEAIARSFCPGCRVRASKREYISTFIILSRCGGCPCIPFHGTGPEMAKGRQHSNFGSRARRSPGFAFRFANTCGWLNVRVHVQYEYPSRAKQTSNAGGRPEAFPLQSNNHFQHPGARNDEGRRTFLGGVDVAKESKWKGTDSGAILAHSNQNNKDGKLDRPMCWARSVARLHHAPRSKIALDWSERERRREQHRTEWSYQYTLQGESHFDTAGVSSEAANPRTRGPSSVLQSFFTASPATSPAASPEAT